MSHSEELTSVAKKILEKNNAKLTSLIGTAVQVIAGEFLAVGLIDNEVDDSMRVLGTTGATRAGTLLSECKKMVLVNAGENFPKFVKVLKKHTILEQLALEMESEFKQAAQQWLNYEPGVHPQPVPKAPNAQRRQQLEETDFPTPKEHQEVQLGGQGKESAKPVCVYPMDTKPHGQAVIFNFVGERNTPRHYPVGSKTSVGKFKETFESLGYEFTKHPFLSGEDMIKRLTENVTDEDDSFVCCIMAHGKKGSIVAKGGQVEIRNLQKEVGENCPKLRGKPKIFIVQACRGGDVDEPMDASEDDEAEDEALSAQLSREADFYIAYSTTEGHISTINDRDGCRYLNTLCDVFKKRAADLTLDEMVMEVHHTLEGTVSRVRKKGEHIQKHIQMGQVVHTLRGPVRFK